MRRAARDSLPCSPSLRSPGNGARPHLDTVRRLRALRSAPPVILMTAFASPGIIDDAQALRVPLLSKPFTLGELRRLAQQTLRRTRGMGGGTGG